MRGEGFEPANPFGNGSWVRLCWPGLDTLAQNTICFRIVKGFEFFKCALIPILVNKIWVCHRWPGLAISAHERLSLNGYHIRPDVLSKRRCQKEDARIFYQGDPLSPVPWKGGIRAISLTLNHFAMSDVEFSLVEDDHDRGAKVVGPELWGAFIRKKRAKSPIPNPWCIHTSTHKVEIT